MRSTVALCIAMIVSLILSAAGAAQEALALNEAPAGPGDWGYRPADNAVVAANPPGFS